MQSTLAAEQIQRRARLAEIHHETQRLRRHAEAIDPAQLMAMADRRLYSAKAAGRDRIVAFTPPGMEATAPVEQSMVATGAHPLN